MKEQRLTKRNCIHTTVFLVTLLLQTGVCMAETALDQMKQGRIDSINLPTLIINDRVYNLANSVTVRHQGRSVGTASLSKGQNVAYRTGTNPADSLTITEIVIAPLR